MEVEPVNATNAVTWHSGTASAQFTASTSGFSPVRLPVGCANLSPGWHSVDIVYTKGFFAVYYDGEEYTSYTSSNVTGDPLNIYFSMVSTPATSAVEKQIGSAPVNSDSAPTTYTVRSLKIWSSANTASLAWHYGQRGGTPMVCVPGAVYPCGVKPWTSKPCK